MKISRYNHFFNREGKYFVYNSLTNSFAQLDIDTYELLVRRIKLDESKAYDDYFDAATLKLLRSMKVLDVNDDTEVKRIKYKALSQRFNSNNLSLTINPTLACNFRCSYCFEESHAPIMMDDKVEDEIIEYIKSFREVKNLFVTWFGGEPLIAFKRIKSLTYKIFELGIGYGSGMITNGYLLNRSIILQLEELKINSLQITLDGRAETHDKRRFLKGGFPTYNHIIDNIKLAQELSPRTRINIRVNVDKSNAEEFIDVYRNITNFKFPNVHVYPGFVTDTTGNDCNSCLFNAEDMSTFINNIYCKYGIYIPMIYPDGKFHHVQPDTLLLQLLDPKESYINVGMMWERKIWYMAIFQKASQTKTYFLDILWMQTTSMMQSATNVNSCQYAMEDVLT